MAECLAYNMQYVKDYVENLINRVKELEENQIWSEATITGLKQDFIPKSKIRENIEEYSKQFVQEDTIKDELMFYILEDK